MEPTRKQTVKKMFATADEAESAFYDAFERANLSAMMAVWAESDDVVCVHPQGPRLVGFEAVRESWMQIFAGGATLRIRATEQRRFDGQSVAVRAVIERVSPAGEEAPVSLVCATNVYELTTSGWRMTVHHASPMAEAPRAQAEEPPPAGYTLH
jgi:ketosteroid isomerase-like protein